MALWHKDRGLMRRVYTHICEVREIEPDLHDHFEAQYSAPTIDARTGDGLINSQIPSYCFVPYSDIVALELTR